MQYQLTCSTSGVAPSGQRCGKVIVGDKFCGEKLCDCPNQQRTLEKASPLILDVNRYSKDGGDFVVRCPHCKVVIGLEGERSSDVLGEQFQHKACGGWLEVKSSAKFVPEP